MKAAVEAHGRDGVVMLTLTIRHGAGDDLKRLRAGLAEAWSYFVSGRPWKRWCASVGYDGYVRAMEVTYGENGWHPHLHVLLFVGDADAATASVDVLIDRWMKAVEKKLGPDQVPSVEHGVTLTPCHDASYITKLGLEVELVGSETKQARIGNRGPWEIADDVCERQEPSDVALWKAYTRGMKGARSLTWSVGLRKRLGLGPERTDQEIAEETIDAKPIAMLDGSLWGVLGRITLGRPRLLEAAEAGGYDGIVAFIEATLGRRWTAWVFLPRTDVDQTVRVRGPPSASGRAPKKAAGP